MCSTLRNIYVDNVPIKNKNRTKRFSIVLCYEKIVYNDYCPKNKIEPAGLQNTHCLEIATEVGAREFRQKIRVYCSIQP